MTYTTQLLLLKQKKKIAIYYCGQIKSCLCSTCPQFDLIGWRKTQPTINQRGAMDWSTLKRRKTTKIQLDNGRKEVKI